MNFDSLFYGFIAGFFVGAMTFWLYGLGYLKRMKEEVEKHGSSR